MIRFPVRCLLVLTLLASLVRAQTYPPVVTAAIADQTGSAGGAPTVIDLREHFGFTGVQGPLVRYDTTFGKFDVELLPNAAPKNVANFLAYVDAARFDNTIIHRTAAISDTATQREIVQGGSFKSQIPLVELATFAPVALEYALPNARGTLAAARTAEPDTATSGWYFNTTDNTATLGPPANSPGYTVFGRVIGSGMEVVDTMATINTFAVLSSAATFPLRFYSSGTSVTTANFIVINSVARLPEYPTTNQTTAALTFSVTSSNPAAATATLDGSNLTVTQVGGGTSTITVRATDVRGAVVEDAFVFQSAALQITAQPTSVDVAAGANVTLSVTAAADTALTYQWYRFQQGNGAPQAITGATGASLTLNTVSAAQMGFYFVRVSDGVQTVQSQAAAVTLAGGVSRLANLSTFGRILPGGTLTPGFVLSGNGTKPVLIRAVGPGLHPYFNGGELADPTMRVLPQGGGAAILTNDNWGSVADPAALRATMASLGAFALGEGSLDAAAVATLTLPNANQNRGFPVAIQSTSPTATGIALAEVYDPEPIGSPVRLINVATLGYTGPGGDALVSGFVIDGGGAKTMLIRVVGPSIGPDSAFGVGDVLVNPRLAVFPSGQSFTVGQNDDWGGTAALKAAFTKSGAFAFTSDGSLDAAIIVRLPPGGYSVVIEGGSGNVLLEAYDLD